MKKLLLVTGFLLITFSTSMAQNTFPTTGNVGIGTSNPKKELHVIGDYYGRGHTFFHAFEGDGNSGTAYLQARDDSGTSTIDFQLRTQKNGVINNVIKMTGDGNVGIGTSNPTTKLHILQNSDPGIDKGLLISENGNEVQISLHLANSSAGQYGYFNLGGNTVLRGNGQVSHFDGSLAIGTTNPGSWKLAVNGNIRAKEIKVETGWSDFVFENDYNLPTLEEVEQHIQEKGHLKDIPSAEDVAQNGIFLGEMDAKLLQKIEELMLYTIAQEKELDEHRKKNKELEERLARLEQSMTDARCPMKGSK